jgi:hypothetical protein
MLAAPSQEQIDALADAMWQLLDDMGIDGKCVSGAAKAQARVASEPFCNDPADVNGLMSIETAREILGDIQ